MKKVFCFLALAATASLVLASCNKENPIPDGYGRLKLSLQAAGVDLKTKGANTELTDAEQLISNYELLVFNDSGELVNRITASPNEKQITKLSAFDLPYGTYSVYALVNSDFAAKSAKTISEMNQVSLDLATYNSAKSDLVQVGSKEITLSSTSKTATETILVNRLVARATLGKVTNNLPEAYGAITIADMYFVNVAGNQNFSGTATTSTWYHPYGQKSVPGWSWINSSNCTAPAFTAFSSAKIEHGADKSFSESNSVYTYANTSEVDINYSGTETYSTTATYLFVALTLENDSQGSGTRRIVGIKLPGKINVPKGSPNPVSANCAYTITGLTINNLPPSEKDLTDGGITPDTLGESKGSFTATIEVNDWTDGGDATYTY